MAAKKVVDQYEADILALLEKAEGSLSKEDYHQLLTSLAFSFDRKADEVLNELRHDDIEEIEQTDYAGSSAPWGH